MRDQYNGVGNIGYVQLLCNRAKNDMHEEDARFSWKACRLSFVPSKSINYPIVIDGYSIEHDRSQHYSKQPPPLSINCITNTFKELFLVYASHLFFVAEKLGDADATWLFYFNMDSQCLLLFYE